MSDVPEIDPATLPDSAVMIDVREQNEWDAGHAPNAVHLPMGDLPSSLDQLPDTDAGTVAVVCRSGGRSARVVAWLVQQGFDVANLTGGMKAWEATGRPMESAGDGQPRVL
jgi:rhodanese-related sulfurtransferase